MVKKLVPVVSSIAGLIPCGKNMFDIPGMLFSAKRPTAGSTSLDLASVAMRLKIDSGIALNTAPASNGIGTRTGSSINGRGTNQ